MSDRSRMQIGAVGGLLAAVVCCAAPLLIVAVGSLGIGTALARGASLLIPILAVVLALAGWHLYRRRASAQPRCNDKSFKEGVKS